MTPAARFRETESTAAFPVLDDRYEHAVNKSRVQRQFAQGASPTRPVPGARRYPQASCEDRWTSRLAAYGIVGIPGYALAGFAPDEAASPEEIATASREQEAAAAVSTQLMLSDFAVVNPGPQAGFGLGSGSGGYRGGGFGLSFPVGGASATRSLASSTSLVDLASGKLIWSGSTTTSTSGDHMSQIDALTRTTLEALQKSGLIH